MVTLIEAVGWFAIAWTSHTVIPISNAIDEWNNHFAVEVDSGNSCFDRVSGIEGHYGGPHEFSLDPLCNYRIKKAPVEGQRYEWILERT